MEKLSTEKLSPEKLSIRPLLIALALLLLIAGFVHYQQQTIAVVPADADEKVFSGARAFAQLSKLLREGQAHPVDSPANRLVEQGIVARLRELGYREEIQADTVCRSFDRGDIQYGFHRCAQVRNIIVHVPGHDEGTGILLSAHYDSVPAAPGASDAGAAVAVLLEVARLLRPPPLQTNGEGVDGGQRENQPRNSIVLLFNEGEEVGLHGAKLFMEKHPLAAQLQVAINIEARGTTSRSVLFETGEDSGWLIERYADTTPAPLSSSLFYEIYKVLPNDTDLTVFKQHGLQGINFAHADNEPHYHTPLDNLTNLDKGSLQHHGDNVWGVLREIKDVDFSHVPGGNLVYTDILGMTIIAWPESYSLGLTLILAGLFIGQGLVLYRRRQLQTKSVALAFSIILLTTLSCVVFSYGAQLLVQMLSGHAQPWRANSLPMEVGIWLLCIGAALAFGFWTRRIQTPHTILLALQLWLLLFALASSLYVPGVSYLFILPAAVSLIASATALSWPAMWWLTKSWLKSGAYLTVVIASAIVFLPIAYFIEISIGFQVAFAVALFVSFVAITLLPLPSLCAISRKTLAWITAAVFVIAGVGFFRTAIQAPYTTYKPQPLNLIYLQRQSQANLVADAMEQTILPKLSQALGAIEVGPILPWSNNDYPHTPTESLDLPAISAKIITSDTNRDAKVVTLALNDQGNNLMGTTLLIPVDSQLQSITLNAQTMNYANTQTVLDDHYVYQCRGQSCGQQQLQLRFLTAGEVTVNIVSHRHGLPESLQPLATTRNGLSIERQSGDQTVVVSQVIF